MVVPPQSLFASMSCLWSLENIWRAFRPALFGKACTSSAFAPSLHVCAQSCPTPCDPMDCSLPGSSVYGIFQARILACLCTKSLQSCPALFNSMDWSPSGASVQGILQARILEWVAISSSKGSSQPRDLTQVSCGSCIDRWILLPLSHLGSPPSL